MTAHDEQPLPRDAAGLLADPRTLPADGTPAVAVLLGAPYSALSLSGSDAFLAPDVVRHALRRFSTWHAGHGVELASGRILDFGDVDVHDLPWEHAFEFIRTRAAEAYGHGLLTIALGGDHSVSWPLISAFARQHERVGIVQLDAHHDVRDPSPTPSNGCPIRGLIESGVVQGRDVVQLGIHPLANARALGTWCDDHGIQRTSAEEVRRRGAGPIARQALRRLAGCDAIYLTVDIDVLDRAHAPGAPAAMPGGLHPAELQQLVEVVAAHPLTRAMDVVEFDPHRDVADITAYTCAQVVLGAIASAMAARTGGQA